MLRFHPKGLLALQMSGSTPPSSYSCSNYLAFNLNNFLINCAPPLSAKYPQSSARSFIAVSFATINGRGASSFVLFFFFLLSIMQQTAAVHNENYYPEIGGGGDDSVNVDIPTEETGRIN